MSVLYEKLSRLDPEYYTEKRVAPMVEAVERIKKLKRDRNAVVLAHNYQRPEIFEVADFLGDSLGLSLKAAEVKDADVIVFCGVHFMAETAKIVNPEKTVLLPNLSAGCSLADMATAQDVAARKAELKKTYPDLQVVTYVNTTADVKAESDACCTSSNAVSVVRALESDHILFAPDQNLARHVALHVPDKTVIAWDGYCYVHHQITPETIMTMRRQIPGIKILVHPECRDDVLKLADAALSTSGMVDYAEASDATDFLAVTECGLSDLLQISVPDKNFYRACKICRFMKAISLDDVEQSLLQNRFEINVDEPVRKKAQRALERMFELTGETRDNLTLPQDVANE
ncbi:MAG: quinolinate synthase NadA [Calditrichaeota bacterium]|nr:quinolinate synthase NadA [Calditrichota bacterium]MCB9368841.1 quinolinate synthase NadA [Calditrichota bacterium]